MDARVTLGIWMLASGCGRPSSPRPTLSVSPPDITLQPCQEAPLTVTVTGVSSPAVVFHSSDETVATVSSTGLVRAIKGRGVAIIHAALASDATVRDSTYLATTSGACSGSVLSTASLNRVKPVAF
jgi:uncharacterized protein YjdB